MADEVLVARGVTVRFGGLVAVDAVDLDVRAGELVGIMGPNGAGKTTLFHTLSGVLRPTAGRLAVNGVDLTGRAPHVFAAHGVARTFQTPRVFREMTVAANIRFAVQFAGRRRAAMRGVGRDVPSILGFLGLDAAADELAGALTPARQRLLEIGMAIGARPVLLLLDEVAAGLSERELAAVTLLVRRLPGELGCAVVWVEHAVGALMAAVDRVIVLHEGRKLADGLPGSVARNPSVVDIYLGGAATTA
jgi:branched-chain amino acid transport system ATP-binding protein